MPPTVRVDVFPSAINGWHSGPVTVSFICGDSIAMASCPNPITVTGTGSTPISGTAFDAAGNQTTASVTVQLDLVPPAVVLTSPSADVTTTDTSITLTGTVSDDDSGLNLVQCNGEDATPDDGVVTCTVPLRPGRNSIVLLARDMAGRQSSRGLRVTRTGTSTTLNLTPPVRTMLVEESAELGLHDEFGAPISAANWTSSDPAVIELSADDPPVLTALAAGNATVTATTGGASAMATITVLVGTSLPNGTTRWTVPATSGTVLGSTIYTHRVAEEVPDLFITEKAGTGEYDATYTVKATLGDGTVNWVEAAPGVPTFGDEEGGLVATIGDDESGLPSGLARFASPSGTAPWRYASTGVFATGGARPAVAQASDGTIFVAEYPQGTPLHLGDSRVVALDGATGAVRGVSWLPRETSYSYLVPGGTYMEPNVIVGPVVGEDGAAYAVYRTERAEHYGSEANYFRRWNVNLTLRRITAEGDASEVAVAHFSCERLNAPGLRMNECTDGQVFTILHPIQVVPDGVGGVLVRWNKELLHPDPNGLYIDEWQGLVTRVVGATASEFTLPSSFARIALVGDGGRTFFEAHAGANAYAVKAFSPSIVDWVSPTPGVPVHATPGNGAVLADSAAGLLHNISGDGVLMSSTPNSVTSPANTLSYGSWIGQVAATVTDTVNISVDDAPFSFGATADRTGNGSAQNTGGADCIRPSLNPDRKSWALNSSVIYWISDPTNTSDPNKWTDQQKLAVDNAFEEWNDVNTANAIPVSFVKYGGSGSPLFRFRKGDDPVPGIPDAYAGGSVPATEPKPGTVTSATITVTNNTQRLLEHIGYLKMGLHEIGHTLGLNDTHGGKRSSVMNQFSRMTNRPVELGGRRDDPLDNIAIRPTSCDIEMVKKSIER